VGHSGQTSHQIKENIMLATEALANRIHRGWSNVQSIHIKTVESIALPIYSSLPSRSDITLKNAKESLNKRKSKKNPNNI
jgi:ribosome biogenesis protein UTP30